MERVIGIDLPTLKRTPRVVGIAGGRSKVSAILASIKGKWVNVLITDRHAAELLVSDPLSPIAVKAPRMVGRFGVTSSDVLPLCRSIAGYL
jgi:hypothetical protein